MGLLNQLVDTLAGAESDHIKDAYSSHDFSWSPSSHRTSFAQRGALTSDAFRFQFVCQDPRKSDLLTAMWQGVDAPEDAAQPADPKKGKPAEAKQKPKKIPGLYGLYDGEQQWQCKLTPREDSTGEIEAVNSDVTWSCNTMEKFPNDVRNLMVFHGPKPIPGHYRNVYKATPITQANHQCYSLIVQDLFCERKESELVKKICTDYVEQDPGAIGGSGKGAVANCTYADLKNAFTTQLDVEAAKRCVCDESQSAVKQGPVEIDPATHLVVKGPKLTMGYRDPIFNVTRKPWESEDLFFQTEDGSRKYVMRVGDRPQPFSVKEIEKLIPKDTSATGIGKDDSGVATTSATIPYVCAPNPDYKVHQKSHTFQFPLPVPPFAPRELAVDMPRPMIVKSEGF